MIKVLFVCLGNICRSPLAEGIFKDLVRKEGLDSQIAVDSAGTSDWHVNDLPDPRTIDIAEKNGITLDHLGRQVLAPDLDTFDYVVAMDKDNFENIKRLFTEPDRQKSRLLLMRDFDDNRSGKDVPDPYYGGPDGFQHVFDLLSESLHNFLLNIRKEHRL